MENNKTSTDNSDYPGLQQIWPPVAGGVPIQVTPGSYEPHGIRLGWQCPVCGRVWAPDVRECPGPHVEIVWMPNPATNQSATLDITEPVKQPT
jgi:hypothetical protein